MPENAWYVFPMQPLEALQGESLQPTGEFDFNVWSKAKRMENLRYMHRNPIKRGLVLETEQWRWSSFRHYAFAEAGQVLVNEQCPGRLKIKTVTAELQVNR